MNAVRGVMETLRGDLDSVERALDFVSGVGGNARQVFYRSANLTMLKVCFPCGRRTPPHDHGTWAVILVLSGQEKNTLYRRSESGLRTASEVTLGRGAILPMRADTAHVAECVGDEPALGLHVYGGDILELPRRSKSTCRGHPRRDARGARVRARALRDVRAVGLEGRAGACPGVLKKLAARNPGKEDIPTAEPAFGPASGAVVRARRGQNRNAPGGGW